MASAGLERATHGRRAPEGSLLRSQNLSVWERPAQLVTKALPRNPSLCSGTPKRRDSLNKIS